MRIFFCNVGWHTITSVSSRLVQHDIRRDHDRHSTSFCGQTQSEDRSSELTFISVTNVAKSHTSAFSSGSSGVEQSAASQVLRAVLCDIASTLSNITSISKADIWQQNRIVNMSSHAAANLIVFAFLSWVNDSIRTKHTWWVW